MGAGRATRQADLRRVARELDQPSGRGAPHGAGRLALLGNDLALGLLGSTLLEPCLSCLLRSLGLGHGDNLPGGPRRRALPPPRPSGPWVRPCTGVRTPERPPPRRETTPRPQ